MSFEAAAWAIKQTPASAREKLILIVLADCHNDNTGQCDPSLQYLMKHALCARSTLVEALDNLEREGFLKRKRGDHKTRTQYKLNLVRLPNQSDNRTSTATELRVVRLPDQPSTATVPKPVNNQEETSTGSFSDFWTLYPKRQAKVKAEKAWAKLKPADRQALLDHLPIRMNHKSWQDPQFIPLPATFINQRRWEDELTAEAKSNLSSIRDLDL